ncbi:MAG: T9SS type A sorting domain-containing protein [Melioribacteraceae bacterium]
MWKKILFLLFVIITSNSLLAQTFDFTGNSPLLKIPITVKSNSDAAKTFNLAFGIDSRATDAVDALDKLGETSLPPAPPAGVMDVRFKVGGSDASLVDIRAGIETLKTGASPKLHKLTFQPGDFVAGTTNIEIEYDIPNNVSVHLKYVVFNVVFIDIPLSGKNTLILTDGQNMGNFNLNLENNMTFDWEVTYNLPDLAVTKIGLTVPDLNPAAGALQTISAQLQDQYDRPFAVAGTPVAWTTTTSLAGSNANLSAATTNTDVTGKATVDLTVATKAGVTHTIKATSGSINKTSDNIIVKAGAASKFNVTVAKTDPAAGSNLQVTGQLQDQYSNNVTEADRAVTWTATNGATLANPSSGNPMIPSYKTDADGKSVIGFTVSQTSGTKHKFTVSATTPVITGESPEVTVIPGAIAKLNVTSNLATAKAGTNVTVSAQLQDAFNNNVTTSGKIITWTKTGGVAGDTGGKFASATSTTNASGIATVDFTLAQTSGVVHTVTGTDNSTPANTGTSGNITVLVNDPNKYMVTSSDANPTVGSNISIDAQLTDLYGNLIATPTAKTVTWSYLGGTKGTFSAATSNTDANGKASVTFTVDEKSGVTQNVKATDIALLTGTSPNIVTKSGAAISYDVTATKYGPVNGDTVKITAQAVDAFKNAVALNGKTITWSSTNDGTFSSPTSTTNANGKATVVFTTKNVPNTEHMITATDNSTPPLTGVSPKIKTVSGPPAKYLVTLSTNNPAAGSQVTVTAQLVDEGNNPHSTAGKEVTWSSTGGGTFAQAKTITDADGKAVVLFTVGTISGNKHKVKATDNTTPTALVGESEEMTIKAAAASKFAVTLDKTDPIANTKVAVTAQLKDQYNNNAPEIGREVSFTSTNGGVFDLPAGMAELTPAKFLTDATGKVTTNFLVVKVAGTKHVATATVPSTSPAITGSSPEITVKSDIPINYQVTVTDTLPKAGKPITVTAQLKDQFANNVPTSGKIVTWSKTGGTGVTGGSFASVTTNTDVTGKATVVFNVAQVSGTTHEVIATDNTTPTALTGKRGNIIVVPDDASKYIVTPTDLNPVAGERITVNAQLADKYDNSVKIAGKSITWTSTNGGTFGGVVSPPQIELGGGADVTDMNGIATTSFLTNTKALTEHIITATDDSAPALKGSSAKVTTKAGPPTKYLVKADSYSVIKGGTTLITGQIADKNDNPIALVGQVVSFLTDNGGVVNPTADTTDAAGKVTTTITVTMAVGTNHVVEVKGATFSGFSANILVVDILPPVLKTPNDRANFQPISILFQWEKSVGATSYHLQISKDSTFATVDRSLTGITNLFSQVEGLENDVTYFWRARGADGTANSAWSVFRRFTTIIAAPEAPNLATPGNNSTNVSRNINLMWNAAPRASYYTIEFADNENFQPLLKSEQNIAITNYGITALEYNKAYFWRVKAYNIGGQSNFSSTFKFTTIDTVLAPNPITATATSVDSVLVEWGDNSNNETGFVLERRKSEMGSTFAVIATLSADIVSYIDAGLMENTLYEYRIKAVKGTINSPYKLAVVLMPTKNIIPPTNLQVTPDEEGDLKVEWEDNSNNEDGFIVERYEDGGVGSPSIKNNFFNSVAVGVFVPIDTIPANSTQYIDKTTKEGAKYQYRVSGFNDEGVSVSTIAAAPVAVVIAPSDFGTKLGENNKVTLTWKDNSKIESGFIIQRKVSTATTFETIDSVDVNMVTFTDEKADEITSYTYRVFAYNAEGNSSFTAYSEVKTGLLSPSDLTGSENGYKVTLTWEDNSKKELKYKIERKSIADPTFKELVTLEKDIVTYIDNVPNANETFTYRIKAVNGDVSSVVSNEFEIKIIMTAVEEIDEIPTDFVIEQNYPNPFNPSTSIRFGLPSDSEVHISIFNLIGEKIAELENGTLPAGTHSVRWNAHNLPSGIYLYSINAKSITDGKLFNSVKKMMLMK